MKFLLPLLLVIGSLAACGGSSTKTSSLTITTTSLPAAAVGVNYSAQLAASGGTPPYQWSVSPGSLPDGITLNSAGLLNGSSTESGSFTFVVEVTDSANTSQAAVVQIKTGEHK